MKYFFLILTFIPTLILSDYLQNGIYPDCSYVIVDQDGWKIHKNQDGKKITMTPSSEHNIKPGKYSFDKFGNLVPFRECDNLYLSNNKKTSNNDVDVKIDIQLNFLNLLKNFKIYGGIATPIQSSADLYESGTNFGTTIHLFKSFNAELNFATYPAKNPDNDLRSGKISDNDSDNDIMTVDALGFLNWKLSKIMNISFGGGLANMSNGIGYSGITSAGLSLDLPLNLGLQAKYSKYIDVKKDDGSIEFDYELLDSFNLNLYYSF